MIGIRIRGRASPLLDTDRFVWEILIHADDIPDEKLEDSDTIKFNSQKTFASKKEALDSMAEFISTLVSTFNSFEEGKGEHIVIDRRTGDKFEFPRKN